jgi:hypothetical protein
MLVVGLNHAARRLHQLSQGSSEHVTLLENIQLYLLFIVTSNSNALYQTSLLQSATFVGNFWFRNFVTNSLNILLKNTKRLTVTVNGNG